jgi:hypothetical protein
MVSSEKPVEDGSPGGFEPLHAGANPDVCVVSFAGFNEYLEVAGADDADVGAFGNPPFGRVG